MSLGHKSPGTFRTARGRIDTRCWREPEQSIVIHGPARYMKWTGPEGKAQDPACYC